MEQGVGGVAAGCCVWSVRGVVQGWAGLGGEWRGGPWPCA